MIIHNEIKEFSGKNCVVTIGTFDGVHLGHRRVIDQLNRRAKKIGGESVLFTFYPHPRLVISKEEQNLRLLTSLDEKTKLLEKSGVDHLVVYPFNREFAELSYETFIKDILIDKLNMKVLVMGHDHKLGKNRSGDFDNIQALTGKYAFEVERTEALWVDGVEISSSKIRKALQKRQIQEANKYLGYTFSIEGVVAEGNQIGRKIGYPTANIEAVDVHKIIPAFGVYAATVKIGEAQYRGMLNIGYRPTVNTNADNRTIEVHLLDFWQDIYEEKVRVYVHQFIRDEKRFDSLKELEAQLNKDKLAIEGVLSTLNF